METGAFDAPGTTVAPLSFMFKPTEDPWNTDENPGLAGPDYVALVVEWNDLEDAEEVDALPERVVEPRKLRPLLVGTIAAVGFIALAVFGIRRLRAA